MLCCRPPLICTAILSNAHQTPRRSRQPLPSCPLAPPPQATTLATCDLTPASLSTHFSTGEVNSSRQHVAALAVVLERPGDLASGHQVSDLWGSVWERRCSVPEARVIPVRCPLATVLGLCTTPRAQVCNCAAALFRPTQCCFLHTQVLLGMTRQTVPAGGSTLCAAGRLPPLDFCGLGRRPIAGSRRWSLW